MKTEMTELHAQSFY